jgi:hypothetical protein
MLQLRFNLKTLFWLTAAVGAFFGGRELGIREESENYTDPMLVEGTSLRDELMEQLRAESKKSEEAREERAKRARRRQAVTDKLLRGHDLRRGADKGDGYN